MNNSYKYSAVICRTFWLKFYFLLLLKTILVAIIILKNEFLKSLCVFFSYLTIYLKKLQHALIEEFCFKFMCSGNISYEAGKYIMMNAICSLIILFYKIYLSNVIKICKCILFIFCLFYCLLHGIFVEFIASLSC